MIYEYLNRMHNIWASVSVHWLSSFLDFNPVVAGEKHPSITLIGAKMYPKEEFCIALKTGDPFISGKFLLQSRPSVDLCFWRLHYGKLWLMSETHCSLCCNGAENHGPLSMLWIFLWESNFTWLIPFTCNKKPAYSIVTCYSIHVSSPRFLLWKIHNVLNQSLS